MKYSALLLLLLLISCKTEVKKTEIEGTLIAQIESSVLTSQHLKEALPSTIPPNAILEYVEEWVNTELLAREARNRGYDTTTSFKKKIHSIEQNLLAMMLLSELSENYTSAPTKEELRSYYEQNTTRFLRKEPYMLYDLLVYSTSAQAWQARRSLTSESFLEAVQQGSADSSFTARIPIPYTALPPEVIDYIPTIREGGIALPRSVGADFHLYHVREKFPEGSPLTFEEALDEVKLYVTLKNRKNSVDSVLATLRSDKNYFFNSDYFAEAPKQTLQKPSQETPNE